MLWDFLKWPEYRGGHISGVVNREVPLYNNTGVGGHISGVLIRGVLLYNNTGVGGHISGVLIREVPLYNNTVVATFQGSRGSTV